MYKRIWHPEMIVHHILLRNGKEPLNSFYYVSNYPDIYAAAERIFGSWGKAIEAAGLDYSLIKKYKTWTKQSVLDEIRRLHKEGEPIFSQNAQNNHKSLYMAALKRFGSWGKAVQTADINYRDVRLRRSMTREEIKKAIIELYRKGTDLSYTNMRANYQYLLAAGMKKLGNGSWSSARRLCGILTNYRLDQQKKRKIKYTSRRPSR